MTGRQPHDWFADFASFLAIIGAFAQVLPAIATLMAIAWYAILIFESRTVQRMRKARSMVESAAEKAKGTLEAATSEAHLIVLDATNEARQVLEGVKPPADPKI